MLWPLPKIKKIPKNTNGRLAIPALAGLLVHSPVHWRDVSLTNRTLVENEKHGFYVSLPQRQLLLYKGFQETYQSLTNHWLMLTSITN